VVVVVVCALSFASAARSFAIPLESDTEWPMYYVGAYTYMHPLPACCTWRDACVCVVDSCTPGHTAVRIHNWQHAESVAFLVQVRSGSPGTLMS
jgi:hypothetical protein